MWKEIFTIQELEKINKKEFREVKLKYLANCLESALVSMKIAIELYKELYQKTEYWEDKYISNYMKKEWYTIRKVNGKLTRYYNEIKEIIERIKREGEKKWKWKLTKH